MTYDERDEMDVVEHEDQTGRGRHCGGELVRHEEDGMIRLLCVECGKMQ